MSACACLSFIDEEGQPAKKRKLDNEAAVSLSPSKRSSKPPPPSPRKRKDPASGSPKPRADAACASPKKHAGPATVSPSKASRTLFKSALDRGVSSTIADANQRDGEGLILAANVCAGLRCERCARVDDAQHGVQCSQCQGYFHASCLPHGRKNVPPVRTWQCAQCRLPPFDVLPAHVGLHERAIQFRDYGLTTLSGVASSEQLDLVHELVREQHARCIETIRILDIGDRLETGFVSFKLRSAGRYDLQLGALTDETHFPWLTSKAPWLPLVRLILGEDCVCIHSGCMYSFPGSATQPYHSDGDHQAGAVHRPPHCLNVFIPLIALTPAHGLTEFVPTSHRLGHFDVDVDPVQPLVAKGEALLFDYRVRHRGRGNSTLAEPRPVVYITYATPAFAKKKAFADANFSAKRYYRMPELPASALFKPSRAERALRRTNSSEDDKPASPE